MYVYSITRIRTDWSTWRISPDVGGFSVHYRGPPEWRPEAEILQAEEEADHDAAEPPE